MSQKDQMHDTTYMESKSTNTNKPIYKTEIDPQAQKNRLVVAKGRLEDEMGGWRW